MKDNATKTGRLEVTQRKCLKILWTLEP